MRDSQVAIAVIAPQEPFECFEPFWEGVWSAAHELAPLGVRVLTIPTLGLDSNEQARALRDLFDEDIEAVVLLAGDSKRLEPLIDQHVLKNRSVVTVLGDAPGSRRTAFVGSDFRLAGRLAGGLLASMLKPRSHIVAFTGRPDCSYAKERYEGFREALSATNMPMGITELEDAEILAAVVAGRKQKYDALYLGCSEIDNVRAILGDLHPGTRCVAFDLTEATKPFLKSGTICGLVDSSRYFQGYIAVQKAFECVQSDSIESAWVPIPSSVILPAHVSTTGEYCSLNSVFETLVRQRTLQIRAYKQALEGANARLQRVAETDPLTELFNFRKFEELLTNEMESRGNANDIALMIVDIDHFRSINDLLGDSLGDQALRLVADTLRSICRSTDVLARVGGDEFALILPEIDEAMCALLSRRIEEAVEEARIPSHHDLRLTVSVGVTRITGKSRNTSQVIESALENARKTSRSMRVVRQLPRTG